MTGNGVFRLGKLFLTVLMLTLLVFVSTAQAAVAPVASGITPSQGTFTPGYPGNLTAAYSDGDGWRNLKTVFVLVSTSSSQKANAVYIRYNQNHNIVSLRNDNNSSWVNCTPGAAAVISNSQVSIDCSRIVVAGSGNDLSIGFDLTIFQAVAGRSFPVYQRAVDDNGGASVWKAMGTLTVTGGTAPPPTQPSPAPSGKKYDWVSYYGSGNLPALGEFGLVDIDVENGAGNYSAADVATLKAGGSTVVSYLNIGAAETFRSYWRQASAYKLGAYEGWPGEYWMDVSQPGFRDLIVNTVAPQLVAKGVDGFYLDNIDVVDAYPQRQDIRQGVVELVRQLRAKYPDKMIIGQTWGLTPLGDSGADGSKMYQYLNAIAKEEVSSTYQGGYKKVPLAESDAMIRELASWKANGLEVYTLDYAITESLASYDYQRSLSNGLRPYAANKDLDIVYAWPFAAAAPPSGAAAAGPEVVITGADSYWASYADYVGRVLTVDLSLVNVGESTSLSTHLASTSTSPPLQLSPDFISPSAFDLVSGDGNLLKLHFVVPYGLESFLLMPDVAYGDVGGATHHCYELE